MLSLTHLRLAIRICEDCTNLNDEGWLKRHLETFSSRFSIFKLPFISVVF